jgi:ABC-type transport system involved in multi-copper enzyme maturation permease subunit
MATGVRRTVLGEWWRYLKGIFTQVLGNPVVARELRVRVRLPRAHWLQAIYLMFLILIVSIAYLGTFEQRTNLDPYRAQQYLQQFYWVIFGTLTTLIVLIAPSLTASAITLERERRTIDLLLATPLTARELLTGKLVGSFGFLVLLLALTLPTSAVCVLLGGATFGEVLESYLMLAMSGLCLCALALFTSAYSRSTLWAVFGGYLLCFGYLGFTLIFVGLVPALGSGTGLSGRELLMPLAVLNPYSAPNIAGYYLPLGGREFPAWVVSVVVCLLFVRLVMTGAARRVGLYDKDVLPSFRRQLVLVAALYTYLTALGTATILRSVGYTTGYEILLMVTLLTTLPMAIGVLLISPIGRREEHPMVDDGLFKPWRMFQPSAAGALPYITLLWLVIVGAMALGSKPMWSLLTPLQIRAFVAATFYLYCAWLLLWGVARFSSRLVGERGLGVARWLAITLATAMFLLPLFFQSLAYGWFPTSPSELTPIQRAWFPMPLGVLFEDMGRNGMYRTVKSSPAIMFVVKAGIAWLCVGLGLAILSRRRTRTRVDVP